MSSAETEIIWLSMLGSGVLVVGLYFLEKFAIYRETPRAERKD